MFRPATPLSILLFVAFVLLLLSVISTPIVKGIPLATFDGIDFGVFGNCIGDKCSGPQIGYDTGASTVWGRRRGRWKNFDPLLDTSHTSPYSCLEFLG